MRKALILALTLGGCGGIDGDRSQSDVPLTSSSQLLVTVSASTHGPLPVSDLASILVNVEEVRVHGPRGWQTIATGPVEVDLLALDEAEFEIAWVELQPGIYKNVRLVLVDDSPASVTLTNGETHVLKTPSGQQSGLKLKGEFKVSACHMTVLDINFDVPNSLHVVGQGHGRSMNLRPVIRAGSHLVDIDDCDPDGPPATPGTESGDPVEIPGGSLNPNDGSGEQPGAGNEDPSAGGGQLDPQVPDL